MLADKAVLVDGAVDAETVGQTSAENSLALGNGRHQRSAMRTMSHKGRRATWLQIRQCKRSTSRERGQDRQQMTVMNAANMLKSMTERLRFVHWLTTESAQEEIGYAIRSSDSERASAVTFAPSGT